MDELSHRVRTLIWILQNNPDATIGELATEMGTSSYRVVQALKRANELSLVDGRTPTEMGNLVEAKGGNRIVQSYLSGHFMAHWALVGIYIYDRSIKAGGVSTIGIPQLVAWLNTERAGLMNHLYMLDAQCYIGIVQVADLDYVSVRPQDLRVELMKRALE